MTALLDGRSINHNESGRKPRRTILITRTVLALPLALAAGAGYLVLIGLMEISLRGLQIGVYFPVACVFYGLTGAVMGALAWCLVLCLLAIPRTRRFIQAKAHAALAAALLIAPWVAMSALLLTFRYLNHSLNLGTLGVAVACSLFAAVFTVVGARFIPRRVLNSGIALFLFLGSLSVVVPLVVPPGVVLLQASKPITAHSGNLHNVVVILIDTLRADHVSGYGYQRNTTPEIDSLAASGVVFENTYAQAPWTQPSVASLITSRHVSALAPSGDQVEILGSIPTMAELFRRNGYQTAGFIANPVVRHFGFSRGYEYFFSGLLDFSSLNLYRYWEWLDLTTIPWASNRSDLLTEKALSWLSDGRNPRTPFFLYLHYMDPHEPYVSRAEYSALFRTEGVDLVKKLPHPKPRFLPFDRLSKDAIDPRSRLGRIDAYDGAIRQNDDAVGSLVHGLKSLGLWRDSVVVLLSDHGEEFADHGGWGHGQSLFNELVRVPLIIRFPEGRWAGHRVQNNVMLLDVLPTLGQFIFGASPDGAQGQSLLPLIGGTVNEKGAQRTSIGELFTSIGTQTAIISGSWKRIHAVKEEIQIDMTFLLSNDTSERNDLAPGCASGKDVESSYSEVPGPCTMEPLLDELGMSVLGREFGFRSSNMRELDEGLRRQLEALGYIKK